MIRSYHEGDREAVLQVWDAASTLAHPFLPDDFRREERQNITDQFLPSARTLVWEVEGVVAGFISMIENEIGGLFVHPQWHRRGIATSLVDAASQDCQSVTVDVFERNLLGRQFYSAYGFLHVDRYTHPETGETLLRLKVERAT